MYMWASTPPSPNPLSGNSFTVSPTVTTNYAVTVTDADDCTAIGDATVKVCELKAVINQPTPTVCKNTPATLTAVGLMGCPPYTYQWSYNNQTTQSITPIASHTATHSVTVTDAFGCMDTAQATVCVNYAGFNAIPTDELIVKLALGVDPSSLEECLDGELIDSCACERLYLIRLNDIDTSNPCFLLDIEERKRDASMDVAEESHLNYRFEYCNTLSDICKNEPYDETPISSPIVVGLIDTGVDGNTAINQWQTDTPECQGGSTGFDFTGGENPWVDDRGHGTHLAHIIQNNEEDAHNIFSARIISEENQDNSSLFGLICSMNAFNAYNDLALDEEKVKVINLSVGIYGVKPTLLEEAIANAESRDIIVTCSAGNGYSNLDDEKYIVCESDSCIPTMSDTLLFSEIDTIIRIADNCGVLDSQIVRNIMGDEITFLDTMVLIDDVSMDTSIVFVTDTICLSATDTLKLNHYPSEFKLDNIVSVTAWNYLDDERPEWGNTGSEDVDLAAPGVGIRTYVSSDSKETKDGTSQATAFVTRYIAQLRTENPSLNYLEIIDLLESQVIEEAELDSLTVFGGRLPDDVVIDCEEVLVPTLSEWGLIILALILLNLGVLSLSLIHI